MSRANRTSAKLRDATGNCVHHWMCEAPAGEFSVARCKKCGAETRFANRIDFDGWRGADGRRPGVLGKSAR